MSYLYKTRKSKILNDPVYGFIEVPYGLIFNLMEHRYFQRLRRIKQLGLAHYVYPGALHTRFHHALGALHLMQEAIQVLRSKDVPITEEEAEGLLVAILLHDIGHGPFSHSLEHVLLQVHHEELSALFMQKLNEEFEGQLEVALAIFNDSHPKRYLHQLVSSQLDMDRLDYLTRDRFFTGVYEGVVGYDRIIKMLTVHEGQLLIEEKGIYSIEKFLVARRLMYWQAYLHKTVLCAGEMLVRVMRRAKQLYQKGQRFPLSAPLNYFMERHCQSADLQSQGDEILEQFAQLDDNDIVMALKIFSHCEDFVLSFLSKGLLNRRLFKVRLDDVHPGSDHVEKLRLKVKEHYGISAEEAKLLVFEGRESNKAYTLGKDEIRLLRKNGSIAPISAWTDHNIQPKEVIKYYLCYPEAMRESL